MDTVIYLMLVTWPLLLGAVIILLLAPPYNRKVRITHNGRYTPRVESSSVVMMQGTGGRVGDPTWGRGGGSCTGGIQ